MQEQRTRDSSEPRGLNPIADRPATDEDIEQFKAAVLAKLTAAVGKDPPAATGRDWFFATALALRDRIIHRWLASDRASLAQGRKRIYYLSLEFLIGRLLNDVVGNLRLTEVARRALGDLGVDYDRIRSVEPDAALGNGGLGRLASCFMESMASLGLPTWGYGIRYDHGLFRQIIKDGWQQEYPEEWLSFRNPWEFERPEATYDILYGGRVETVKSRAGGLRHVWQPAESVRAVAYDTPIVGCRGAYVNALRLWSARAADPMRLDVFNLGDHVGALIEQARAEAISKVLYPSDATPAGRELRLRQEYFFVSASLQDLVQRHCRSYSAIYTLPDHASIQLNDTHPSIAIAELMRILIDQHNVPWDQAWDITVATCSYTNHTLLPEALESWPVPLFERVLPRHLQIIYRINEHHLAAAMRVHSLSEEAAAAVSLIDEEDGRRIRMGHLAFIGSHRTNGVSALHSELLRNTLFADLEAVYPNRVVNVTNGITFRRWLHQANPGLTQLICEVVGRRVLDDPDAVTVFGEHCADPAVQDRVMRVKRANKIALARVIRERLGLVVDTTALFDVHIKRIHEYKRQLLNLIETIALWEEIRAEPARGWVPRVKIFAGKAAAGYAVAKLIVKLANDIATVINTDPCVRDLLQVVFLPNYNVSLAEAIIPAADLSEQISTAGMEASGTGNMKLALNGALTIGTLDGANVEIRERVGCENIFIFGLHADEVAQRRRNGWDAAEIIAGSPPLAHAIDAIASGVFSSGDPHRFDRLIQALRQADDYMVMADFEDYFAAQRRVDALYRQREAWTKACIANIAGMGWFSSDRAIRTYSEAVWQTPLEA
ncbi:MAG: glycogen/starch/alpha-glucan phosphorylase [Alphaproteobacteria bacterium]|nr:glycogen/starch/alpha-glucan phosphorylase [Alphaproteobacteria bacterium]